VEPIRLLLITTGGTIAGIVAGDQYSAHQLPGHGLMDQLETTLADIQRNNAQNRGVVIEPLDLFNLDSSDVRPENWKQIVAAIQDNYDGYDAFVVTHGTNTLGYTCAALSFAFESIGKPVILTGAQVPHGWPGSDAQMNLENAVRVAALTDAPGPLRGVVCVFGSHIITGTRVKKNTEFDYDAFQSFSTSSLGRIGRVIRWNVGNLDRHHSYMAAQGSPLAVKNVFDPRVLSFTEFPGMDPGMFEDLVTRFMDEGRLRGLVFRAYGAGDVSTLFQPALHAIKNRQIPIVVTTQAPNGISNFSVNAPGLLMRKHQLAMPAYDMNIESITTKLMWLLAQDLDHPQIVSAMATDLRGEISVDVDRRPS
jgi:L-asparaginase